MKETKAWSHRGGFHIGSRSVQGTVSLNHLVHFLENLNCREISCQSTDLLWNYWNACALCELGQDRVERTTVLSVFQSSWDEDDYFEFFSSKHGTFEIWLLGKVLPSASALFDLKFTKIGASQVALVVKNPPANAGDVRDTGSFPGLGRSPGGGHGSPLQYSCLENPMDRGAWQATVHSVSKSQTRLKWLSTHTQKIGDMRAFVVGFRVCQRK